MMANKVSINPQHRIDARRQNILYLENTAFVELVICLAIIILCIALITPQFSLIVKKTKLLNALALFNAHMPEMAVNFALSGEAFFQVQSNQTASDYLPLKPSPDYSRKYSYELINGIFYVTSGESPEVDNFFLSISPTITEHEPPWNIIWSCGKRPVPSGWLTPVGAKGTNLPDELLLSMCRNNTGQPL